MKATLFKIAALAFCLCLFHNSVAQQRIRFGRPSKEDLQMNSYPLDKEAEAVMLFESNKIRFELIESEVRYIYEHEMRIKLLSENAREWASFHIPYHSEEKSKDEFSELKACMVTLVDGVAVKTELSCDSISDINSGGKKVKTFTLSDAVAGSIIDVKYTIKSEYISDLPSVDLQHTIPVRYSYYSFDVPDYLVYSIMKRGSLELVNEHYNIPALRNTQHIYCLKDHIAGFDYELLGFDLIDAFEDLTISWEDFCKTLNTLPQFGGAMKTQNLFAEEVAELKEAQMTDFEKINKMLRTVQQRVAWNGKHSLTCNENGISHALETGSGNSADMNFLLYCALRDLGFQIFPVMLNPRYMGKMPPGDPMLNKINAFILLVKGSDMSNIYVDASDSNAFVNVIPPAMLVSNAQYFSTKGVPTPVDLTKIGKNQTTLHIEYDITDAGAKGSIKYKYNNQTAYQNNLDYSNFATEREYVEDFVKSHSLTSVTGFSRSVSETAAIVESCQFEQSLEKKDDRRISFHPFLKMIDFSNVFTEQNRQLPVELEFPLTYNIVANISIPEGWEIEAMPKSAQLEYGNRDLQLTIQNAVNENRIISSIRYNINRLEYKQEEYPDLSGFYAKLAEVIDQNIVLRKL